MCVCACVRYLHGCTQACASVFTRAGTCGSQGLRPHISHNRFSTLFIILGAEFLTNLELAIVDRPADLLASLGSACL